MGYLQRVVSAADEDLVAAHCSLIGVLGSGIRDAPANSVRGADLGPDPDRRFDFAITHDRQLVLAAARSLLQRISG
jgi:hypothetical protein